MICGLAWGWLPVFFLWFLRGSEGPKLKVHNNNRSSFSEVQDIKVGTEFWLRMTHIVWDVSTGIIFHLQLQPKISKVHTMDLKTYFSTITSFDLHRCSCLARQHGSFKSDWRGIIRIDGSIKPIMISQSGGFIMFNSSTSTMQGWHDEYQVSQHESDVLKRCCWHDLWRWSIEYLSGELVWKRCSYCSCTIFCCSYLQLLGILKLRT